MVRTQSEKAVLRRSTNDHAKVGLVPWATAWLSKHNVFSQIGRGRCIVAPVAVASVLILFAQGGGMRGRRNEDPASAADTGHRASPPPLRNAQGRVGEGCS